ncbi:MAG: hypothetical protein NDI94_01555 [Candidatus Woesearchaeota archaeon]|nr:hypothetical protein [Candidatus Woesearchaeota archaeon]
MTIPIQQAKADLEAVMATFGTLGPGDERGRAAQLVMQTLGVLERRLGNPTLIKLLYIDNNEASKLIPLAAYTVAQEYVNGTIAEPVAKERLQEASKQYAEAFKEMGITLQPSILLYGKE